jgi:hypothetical protein
MFDWMIIQWRLATHHAEECMRFKKEITSGFRRERSTPDGPVQSLRQARRCVADDVAVLLRQMPPAGFSVATTAQGRRDVRGLVLEIASRMPVQKEYDLTE